MMSEKEEKEDKILTTFQRLVPKLSELQKERLLGFGEGLEYATACNKEKKCS